MKTKVFLQAKWTKAVRLVLLSITLAASLMTVPLSAWAHDATLEAWFEDFNSQEVWHQDQEPFKGWIYLTVTNRGTQPWGDFHFQISGASSVVFLAGEEFGPFWSRPSNLSYQIGSGGGYYGSSIDLFFYGDPVFSGEQVSFQVYTDNTTNQEEFFGVCFRPTPVPIPGALWLLGSGLLGLVGLRGKLGKA